MSRCDECRRLSDEVAVTEDALQNLSAESSPEVHYEIEKSANMARARYEIHLLVDHHDEKYRANLSRNFDTLLWGLFCPDRVLH